MLVLTRRQGERINIGPDIVITVTEIDRGKCRIGIEAPKGVQIWRSELNWENREGKQIDTPEKTNDGA